MGRPAKPDGERVRDIAPTGVRLVPDLRDALAREAAVNGRSLSKEIEQRLRDSVARKVAVLDPSASTAKAMESAAAYVAQVSDQHRQLLALFDALTPDRQLALLTLLRK